MISFRSVGLVLGFVAGICVPAAAQNLFAPVATVNDSIVTGFEVQQRARFLTLLNAPGATTEGALEALIEDRLKLQAARQVGLVLTDDGLETALGEFAGRANLSTEEFVAALARAGVERETYRDFVAAQVLWRDLIRARYGPRVQVSEADIDRAVAASKQSSGIRVLLSEIIMPAPAPRRAEVLARAEQISQAGSVAAFSNYARRFSATASRSNGGRLAWTELTALPPALRPIILALAPGEITEPLALPDAVALFQLRDIAETGRSATQYAAIEHAAYYVNATQAEADRIRGRVDVCDDLYGVALGQPDEALDRQSLPPSEVPQDFAIELAKLDPGEVSTALTRNNGATRVVLMLCGRTPVLEQDADRGALRNRLQQSRFQGFADAFLEELRADARIEIAGQ